MILLGVLLIPIYYKSRFKKRESENISNHNNSSCSPSGDHVDSRVFRMVSHSYSTTRTELRISSL